MSAASRARWRRISTRRPKRRRRPSLYGHGLLGSANEVRGGTGDNVDIMANTHQMMFCATDWSGFSSEDVGYAIQALQDFSLLGPVFDRQQQGFSTLCTWRGC